MSTVGPFQVDMPSQAFASLPLPLGRDGLGRYPLHRSTLSAASGSSSGTLMACRLTVQIGDRPSASIEVRGVRLIARARWPVVRSWQSCPPITAGIGCRRNRAEAFARQECLLCRPRPSQAGAFPMESMMRDGHRPRSHHAPIEARGEALQNRDDEGDRRSVDLDPLASEFLEG